VSKDVPPYAIMAGNPARVVRMRFDEAIIARLLAVAWWNWPIDNIMRNVDAIAGSDIDRLEGIR
jgi:virginiamycin A acetyltransferase